MFAQNRQRLLRDGRQGARLARFMLSDASYVHEYSLGDLALDIGIQQVLCHLVLGGRRPV